MDVQSSIEVSRFNQLVDMHNAQVQEWIVFVRTVWLQLSVSNVRVVLAFRLEEKDIILFFKYKSYASRFSSRFKLEWHSAVGHRKQLILDYSEEVITLHNQIALYSFK